MENIDLPLRVRQFYLCLFIPETVFIPIMASNSNKFAKLTADFPDITVYYTPIPMRPVTENQEKINQPYLPIYPQRKESISCRASVIDHIEH